MPADKSQSIPIASGPSPVLGIDIGGANVKFATSSGEGWSQPFELWRSPEQLASLLAEQLQPLRISTQPLSIAVTMTGELADCFTSKQQGVCSILESCRQAGPQDEWAVYLTTGTFATLPDASQQWQAVAAANWHALTNWIAQRLSSQTGVLIDVGTTTSDLIPFAQGKVCSQGKTDPQRLAAGELVYLGAERTPLPMLVDHLRLGDQCIGIARELFATSLDAHLLLDLIAERPADCGTADSRPATREFAHARLARLICADPSEVTLDMAQDIARQVVRREQELLADAFTQVAPSLSELDVIVLSGQADYLVRPWLEPKVSGRTRIESLGEQWPDAISRVGPAFAVACLWQTARPDSTVANLA